MARSELTATFEETLSTAEALIRAGKGTLAAKKLLALQRHKLPRALLLRTASLGRRAGTPLFSIRVLNRLVRPPSKHTPLATDAEKAEYAACLTRIGAAREALDILRGINFRKCPEALLYEVFALVTRWEYGATIPLLERYIGEPSLSDYQRLVGKVNLAAALIQERRLMPAGEILSALREETKDDAFSLLHGNSLELSAQQAIFLKEWKEAEQYLSQAKKILAESGGLDALFVRKWEALLDLYRTKGSPSSLSWVQEIRSEAIRLRHWETVRDCDYYRAVVCEDIDLATRLYFGTPFESYRRRLKRDFGKGLLLPSSFAWELPCAPSLRKNAPLQVWRMGEGDGAIGLKPGQLLFRLLGILASDFYRPMRIASVHALLYPEAFFNPVSSPVRVHQAIKRLKQWLRKERFPFSVIDVGGAYALHAARPSALRVTERPLWDRLPLLLAALHAEMGTVAFSAVQAAERLRLSGRTTLRLLQSAVKARMLHRSGTAATTKYYFK